MDLLDGIGKTLLHGVVIGTVNQPSSDVARVGSIHLNESLAPLINFANLKLRGLSEVRHARAQHRGRFRGRKYLQSFHGKLQSMTFAAEIKPQQTEGKRGVDGCLRLLRVHSQQGKGGESLAHQPARVDRAETM